MATTPQRIVCFGSGGHASVVVDAALASGLALLGYVVPASEAGRIGESGPHDLPVLAAEGPQLAARLTEIGVSHFIVAIGSVAASRVHARQAAFAAGLALRLEPAAVVHPSAVVAASASVGPGSFVAAGAILNPFVAIGRNVIVNTRASIDHHCLIGDHAHVAPGSVLGGGVIVGEAGHVGIGSVIGLGCVIGDRATVGAGAVVIHDVSPDVSVYGVPARIRPPAGSSTT